MEKLIGTHTLIRLYKNDFKNDEKWYGILQSLGVSQDKILGYHTVLIHADGYLLSE